MLVPTVLRNIVLPYLRAGAGGSTVNANATAASSLAASRSRTRHVRQARAASISSSTRQARPADAAVKRDASPDASFRIWEPQVVRLSPSRRPPPEPPRPTPRLPSADQVGSKDDSRAKVEQLKQRKSPPTSRGTEPNAQPAQQASAVPATTATTDTRRSSVDVPPALQKLLRAKLYRMAVFHIIRTPELMTNATLVVHIVELLEKKGAGKLAQRLRDSMDLRQRADVDANEPIRLWSNRSRSEVQRPPTWWRLPVIPRDVESYPEASAQERTTHYYNHLLTSYLTKEHAAPYRAPLRPGDDKPRGPLGSLKKTLKFVDYLREQRGFVPDRVTVNIVVKAWLNSMAVNTEGHGSEARSRHDRQGLGSKELRGIFDVVGRTIERDIAALKDSEISAPVVGEGTFNRAINYAHHVKPFGNMMRRAFTRVGDHEGRIATERWMWRVAKRLGVEESALHAAVRKAGAEMKKAAK